MKQTDDFVKIKFMTAAQQKQIIGDDRNLFQYCFSTGILTIWYCELKIW
jgi:hypothetical protein